MYVKIIRHCCVPYEDYDYTQADGVFELPDGIARKLIDGGTCVNVEIEETDEKETEEETTEESEEVLSLLSSSRASVLYPVLVTAGYTTAQSVLDADMDDLVALHGIGEKTAEVLQNSAYAFLNDEE